MVNVFALGAFSDEEKDLLRTDLSYKKRMSKINKGAREAAKRDTCYVCGKRVTSFCNSHSVPRFCLENIASKGEVLTLNAIVDNPLLDRENGVKKAGTFHLICNDCDNTIFSDYENPDNYALKPTAKMIAQVALVLDFEGNIINNIYNPSPKYVIQNIHISILPLKTETIIVMFIEDGDTRYSRFYKQFNKLPLNDKLAALTYIIFLYSEDMYYSKSIEKEVVDNPVLCSVGKTTQDIFSFTPFFDPIETLKESHDLSKRHEIPNLLSEKYKIN